VNEKRVVKFGTYLVCSEFCLFQSGQEGVLVGVKPDFVAYEFECLPVQTFKLLSTHPLRSVCKFNNF